MRKFILVLICALSLVSFSCKSDPIESRLDRLETLIQKYADEMSTATEEGSEKGAEISEEITTLLTELGSMQGQMTTEQSARYVKAMTGSLGAIGQSIRNFIKNVGENIQ